MNGVLEACSFFFLYIEILIDNLCGKQWYILALSSALLQRAYLLTL